jgi:4-aminobutyrate aminotransferase/(S)-3-amino-2-methylpropionate transaminase
MTHCAFDFTAADELSSCMNNMEPGSPRLSILSFTTGFHGRISGYVTSC